MMYFNGYDIDGNSYRVEEAGNGIGYIKTFCGRLPAVRLTSSTYMATDGKVYAANRERCSAYATVEWINWARQKMRMVGFRPEF